jgi:hypothetical protein
VALGADAVGRRERQHVGGGVPLHDTLPVIARIDARVLRLVADGRRVQQHLGTGQRQGARAFRKPLIPADRRAERSGGDLHILLAQSGHHVAG